MENIHLVIESIEYEGDGVVAAYDNQAAAQAHADFANQRPLSPDTTFNAAEISVQSTFEPHFYDR